MSVSCRPFLDRGSSRNTDCILFPEVEPQVPVLKFETAVVFITYLRNFSGKVLKSFSNVSHFIPRIPV